MLALRRLAGRKSLFALILPVAYLFFASANRYHGTGYIPSMSLLRSRSTSDDYLSLTDDTLPETIWVKGLAGYNYFQNLYLSNGTWIAYCSNIDDIPPVSHMLSAYPGEQYEHDPAGEDRWRVVVKGKEDPLKLFSRTIVRKPGISMFFNDETGGNSKSFLTHYFHFIGEVFLAGWRVLSTAGETELPSRLMYRTTPDDWRDPAGLTTWFQQSVMPRAIIEDASVWEDRANSGMTFLFDKISLVDRWAAHAMGENPRWWNKMTADMTLLDARDDWLDPLRNPLKHLVETSGCSIERLHRSRPVVTYINRQMTARRLRDEDAESLIREMRKLDEEGVIQFVDAIMERESKLDQFCMALRSDIILGVHGNGLSHALWMRPHGAMIEILNPPGFAMDYALIGEIMHHEYYAIHNDTVFPPEKWRRPDGYGVDQGDGFHGRWIPVHAPFIASLIRDIAARLR